MLDTIVTAAPPGERRTIAVPAPGGHAFTHAQAQRLAQLDRLILICGHYEGIDERLAELYPIEEFTVAISFSPGGGWRRSRFWTLSARLVPGVIDPDSAAQESFANGLLDHPSYTRPATFRGVDVPPVLLSGDHAKIAAWRREQSRARTIARRADLLADGGAEPEA